MEGSNGVSGGGGMLPASMGSEMQGLEMSLHHPHHTTTTPSHPNLNPNPHPQQQHHHHHHLLPFPPAAQRHEGVVVDHSHPPSLQQHQHQQLPSPWQRMKWTDSMVRLLIMIVYCVGDDASGTATDQGEQHGAAASASVKGKKAPPTTSTSASASAGLLLQKKGKWKSVSRAMMEKGFYVSPQQCEDKFNDLNKRYKRVNELLGKGTACRVVENQALLDSLDHVSPKAKDEARKLLNSKHLFFREMCAYHNSSHPSSSTCAPALPQPPHSQPLQPFQSQSQSQSQQPHCLHHPSDSSISISFPGSREPLFAGKGRGHSSCSMLGGVNEEKDHHHDDNYIDDDDTGDDDDEVEGGGGEDYDDNDEEDLDKEGFDDNKSKQHQHQHDRRKKESKVEAKGTTSMLMLPTSPLSASPPLSLSLSSSPPAPVEQLRGDLMGSLASMGGEQQQKQWLKRKAAELEEQRVGYQCQALELERQHFKWLRFSSNKEREMDRMKLRNERLCLENDRMLLLLRQKEQELINASADAAPTTTTSSNHNPLQISAVHHNLLH